MTAPDLEEEEKFIALLRTVHRFPTAYDVRVICLAAVADALPDRVVAETGFPLVGAVARRESTGAKYVSLHMQLKVEDAPDVVRVYRCIKAIEGVKSYF